MTIAELELENPTTSETKGTCEPCASPLLAQAKGTGQILMPEWFEIINEAGQREYVRVTEDGRVIRAEDEFDEYYPY